MHAWCDGRVVQAVCVALAGPTVAAPLSCTLLRRSSGANVIYQGRNSGAALEGLCAGLEAELL